MEVVLGLDVGTTSCKAVAYDPAGDVVSTGAAAMSWTRSANGVECHPGTVWDACATALATASGVHTVRAIGITSMAESGVLVDGGGDPVAPLIAWHDTRDHDDAAALDAQLGAATFSRTTGKPWGTQFSLTKHRWTVRHVPAAQRAVRRFNVAEWVAHRLGASPVTDRVLACRTGWWDLHRGDWWPDALAFSEIAAEVLPPVVAPGTPIGHASGTTLPSSVLGAVLTTAGHDHQAAAAGVAAQVRGRVLDSSGTAEALVRTIEPVCPDAVLQLATEGITVDESLLDGHWSLLGGTLGGLRLGRVVTRLSADLPSGELDRLAATAAERTPPAGWLDADPFVPPAGWSAGEVWRAAARSTAEDAARLLASMDRHVGSHDEVVVVGGWSRSSTVMAAKHATLGRVRPSPVAEAGTLGAARLAARAADLDWEIAHG